MESFPVHTLAKTLILVGGVIVLVGLILLVFGKIPLLGKMPGDITIRGKGFSIYFPIVTGIVLSLLLTLIANLFFRK